MIIVMIVLVIKQVVINDIGFVEDFLVVVEKILKFFNDGDIIEGMIVKIDCDEVFFDVGYKIEGVIFLCEFLIKYDVDFNEVVVVGDQVEVFVFQKEDKEGCLIFFKKCVQYECVWGDVEKIKENDGVVIGMVIEVVKGGFIVDIGFCGFLFVLFIELCCVCDFMLYFGQEIEVKIFEFDKNCNNVVLSCCVLFEQMQLELCIMFLNNLYKGQVCKGVVLLIVNFGVFVDLGGVDGFVYVLELFWKYIEYVFEVVEVGQEVIVEIFEVDFDCECVFLLLKVMQEDLWQVFVCIYVIGQVMLGKVIKFVLFGVFVCVVDGIEGLVYIFEFFSKYVELVEQVVFVGEEVFVKVIDIDFECCCILLLLKQVNELVDFNGIEFDLVLYGMFVEYDENGEYKYLEGFDVEIGVWKEGFDVQCEVWEQEYVVVQVCWEVYKVQVVKVVEVEVVVGDDFGGQFFISEVVGVGIFVDDEVFVVLCEKFLGGNV